jgi:hypothetical protein
MAERNITDNLYDPRKGGQAIRTDSLRLEDGWVDLGQPIIVRAGDGFIAVPGSMDQSNAADSIILVACCGPKLTEPAPAADLYVSPLFKKARMVGRCGCNVDPLMTHAYDIMRGRTSKDARGPLERPLVLSVFRFKR